ncbi:hypothetical protein PORY_002605 [Pneumocystis oryctolagi]|uniref:Uncharacterized protein n=1 Tax=Pneumocystis oryctolagi TaxID=42067 RepID=A0ACB7CA77_9ASCO|nr:hypothetical protein PORY_002605 [Pneumocystis oryctolagi]
MSSSLSYTPCEDRTVNVSCLSLGSLEQSFHPELNSLPQISPLGHLETPGTMELYCENKSIVLLQNASTINSTNINNFQKNINNTEQIKDKTISTSISCNKSLLRNKDSSLSDISLSFNCSDNNSEPSIDYDQEQKSLAILEESLPILEDKNDDIQIVSLLSPYNDFKNIETPIKQRISSQIIPTDTTVTRINDIKIPQSAMKSFKEHLEGIKKAQELEKPGSRLTLREQSNVIDSLRKEKWDLQMKVFLLQQYRDRSRDEAVEEMIKQNIELVTTVRELNKTNKNLRRIIKDMEMHTQGNIIDYSEKHEKYEKMLEVLQNKIKAYEIEVNKLQKLSPNNITEVFDEFENKETNQVKKYHEEFKTESKKIKSKNILYQEPQNYRNNGKCEICQFKNNEAFNNISDIKFHNELRDCITELKFKNQTLKEENNKLSLELENLDILRENEIIKLENNYNEELDRLHNLLNELNNENENLRIDKINVIKEINSLSEEYANFKEEAELEIRIREEEILKMVSDIEDYEKTLKKKNEHINNLLQKAEEANIQTNKLVYSYNEIIHDLKEKHLHAKAVIDNLTQQQEASIKELNYFRESSKNPSEISILKEKIHALEQKNIQANNEINHLKENIQKNEPEYSPYIEMINTKRKIYKDIDPKVRNNFSINEKIDKIDIYEEEQHNLETFLDEILNCNSLNKDKIIIVSRY